MAIERVTADLDEGFDGVHLRVRHLHAAAVPARVECDGGDDAVAAVEEPLQLMVGVRKGLARRRPDRVAAAPHPRLNRVGGFTNSIAGSPYARTCSKSPR